jgi:hypothetical protein
VLGGKGRGREQRRRGRSRRRERKRRPPASRPLDAAGEEAAAHLVPAATQDRLDILHHRHRPCRAQIGETEACATSIRELWKSHLELRSRSCRPEMEGRRACSAIAPPPLDEAPAGPTPLELEAEREGLRPPADGEGGGKETVGGERRGGGGARGRWNAARGGVPQECSSTRVGSHFAERVAVAAGAATVAFRYSFCRCRSGCSACWRRSYRVAIANFPTP